MKNRLGFTLIEIMITVIVLISITMMAVFTMTNYVPKQRLLDSLETVEQTLSRAQMEATARSTWSCIKIGTDAGTGVKTLSVFMDSSSPIHGSANACGTGTDLLITKQALREDVDFTPSSNTGCSGTGSTGAEATFNFSTGEVWFDTAGVPKECLASGSCVARSFTFVVSSSKLSPGNKAREVEAISSGLIAIVNRNEKGYMDGVWANTANQPNGCE